MSEINEQTKEVDPELLAVPEIREAIELSEEAAYTKEELASYETYWDTVSTEKTLLAERYQLGKEEGRAEEKVEIAKKLIAQKIDIKTIVLATGLSVSEIEQLKK